MEKKYIKKPLILFLSLTGSPANRESVLFWKNKGGNMPKLMGYEIIKDQEGFVSLLTKMQEADDFDEVLKLIDDAKEKIETKKDLNDLTNPAPGNKKNEPEKVAGQPQKGGYLWNKLKGVVDNIVAGKVEDAKKVLEGILRLEENAKGINESELAGKLKEALKIEDPEEMKAAIQALITDSSDFEKSGESVNLFDQEIMSTGWLDLKGIEVKEGDIDEIAANFTKLHETIKPPLKIGHSEEQPFAGDMPSLGWIDNVRKEGSKLLADFKEVPAVVAELIRKGAYKRISPEIYSPYIDADETDHGRVLRAVVLEGAEIPAFKDLKDVQALYQKNEFKDNIGKWTILIKTEKTKGGDMSVERLVKVEKATGTLLDENIKLKVEKFMEDNKTKILPTYEPLLKAMLVKTAKNEDAVIKFKEEDNEREFSIHQSIKELVTRMKDVISFDEIAQATAEAKDKETAEYEKVNKYALENKITFADADRILREKGDLV